jgi:hypothetical protein
MCRAASCWDEDTIFLRLHNVRCCNAAMQRMQLKERLARCWFSRVMAGGDDFFIVKNFPVSLIDATLPGAVAWVALPYLVV